MIQIYKLICNPKIGAYDSSIPPLFQPFARSMRGHDKKLIYDSFNKDIRKYSFTIRAAKLWNSLPQHVVDSETIIQFERNLDKHWLHQPIYYEEVKADINL